MLGSVADRLPRIALPLRRRAPAKTEGARSISVGREVLLFVAGCALAAGLIGGASFWEVNQAATAEAINDAEAITQLARTTIATQGLLNSALIAGDPAAIARLSKAVSAEVISRRLVRLKIWTTGGTIIYSDASGLIGEKFDLGDDEENALAGNRTAAEVSDLSRPENRYEKSFGKLLEVYLPVEANGGAGPKLLFETYQVYSAVQADQQRVWNGVFPALVAGLALLFIFQIPLSWRLARRLQRSSRDRAALLQRAIDSSETERWRIAGIFTTDPCRTSPPSASRLDQRPCA